MGAAGAFLAGCRVLALLLAMFVVGLGAWIKVMVHDIDLRGKMIVKTNRLPVLDQLEWLSFFIVTDDSQLRLWISIITASLTTLLTTLTLLSFTLRKLSSPKLLLPIELASLLSISAAFGASLSLALQLASSQSNGLNTARSADLRTFTMLFPLTKVHAATAAVAVALLLCTSITALVRTLHRIRDEKELGFRSEEASHLEMNYSYPSSSSFGAQKPAAPLPNLYSPQRPLPGFGADEEQRGLAGAGAAMGGRESGGERTVARKSMGLALRMGPARPWSTAPRSGWF